ncbi:unnamed protein product [Bursaphelenchus xylophilus]|uniref:Sodium/hydrogen exchanger n=1 Tax=Bursaphelenchus xylophilus TaxID=6326 RepID=A0A1I7RWC7_BURXY|nr:unnamed protein product [Bursaphelenchus xylophilus]CAG9095465.1 unnamed protein product [Bursaphelenchus xylophilus]
MAERETSNLIGFNVDHVQIPLQVVLWLLAASAAKILFHANKKMGEKIPDSALLISLGLLLGLVFRNFNLVSNFTMDSTVFFLYLLPPIVFEAGYFMPNRQLFDNIGSVAMFAIFGTVWNTITIGATLYYGGYLGLYTVKVNWPELFTYAALISAIDPVAVIVVFEELHVNEFLFINVFGEALFNDGVAAVLFQIFNRLTLLGPAKVAEFSFADYFVITSTGCFVAIGGIIFGVVFAFLCALSTKHTQRVKIVGPVFVFLFPYLAYLTAEMFALSAILAICFCGIFMKDYVKGNISVEAAASVKYFVKMLAQASETVVFMFLGLSAVGSPFYFDFYFVLITLVACAVYRALGVVIQCAILNPFLQKKFSFSDQFVMSYGGLRGAVAFGLLSNIPSTLDQNIKDLFKTTTIIVICFTVFVQGTTIRPILNFLQIEKKSSADVKFVERVFDRYFDYTLSGIEDIIDQKGYNTFRSWYERLNSKYLKPFLIKDTDPTLFDPSAILRAYNKVTAGEVLALNQEILDRKRAIKKTIEIDEVSGIENIGFDNDSVASASTTGNRELQQFLHKEENLNAMCSMIERIVSQKLQGYNHISSAVDRRKSTVADIQDDYLHQLKNHL